MKIGIMTAWSNDGQKQNFIGDFVVAERWQKWLLRRDDVERCDIIPPGSHAFGLDVCIHFHYHIFPVQPCRNVHYLQSAWPVNEHWPNGTVGVYRETEKKFDGFIFPSDKLQQLCEPSKPSCVVPFAGDPEDMYLDYDENHAHKVVFVGNDIRPDDINERFLGPYVDKGLVLFGGKWRDPKFQACHCGKVTEDQLRKIYSSSELVLNLTHPVHKENGVINERVYAAALCEATMLTDGQPEMMTRWDVLVGHTYERRMRDLVQWLKGWL